MRLSESSVTMRVGETFSLGAVVNPPEAEYDGIVWESSDPFIASVSNGLVLAHKFGTARLQHRQGGNARPIIRLTIPDCGL